MTQTENNQKDGTDEQDDQEYNIDEDARSFEEAKEDHEHAMSKRSFMKAVGAAGAVAAGGTAATGNVAAGGDWLPDLPSTEDAKDAIGDAASVSAGAAGMVLTGGNVAAAGAIGMTVNNVLDALDGGDGGATADTVQDAIYNDALLSEKNIVESLNQAQDELDQTAALSRAEAKAIAFKAISDEQGESTASTRSTERINEYFAGVQEAFYRAQEHAILQVESYFTTISNTSNLAESDVFNWSNAYNVDFEPWGSYTIEDVDVTLIDGRTITLRRMYMSNSDDTRLADFYYYGSSYEVNGTGGTFVSVSSASETTSSDGTGLASVLPDASTSNSWGFNEQYTSWASIDSQIKTAKDNAQSDVSTVINDVFANYTKDQLSEVDEFISPMQRTLLSTEDWTQTAAPVYPQMVSHELGIPTSQAGYSLTIEYTPSTANGSDGTAGTSDDTFGTTKTMNGTLWGFEPSNTSKIQTGTTYYTHGNNSLSLTPSFSEVKDDGTVVSHDLTGKFTITAIKTGDGSNVDKVGTYDTTITTADTSNLVEQIKEVIERRDEEDEESPNSGGGGFFGDSLPWWVQLGGGGGLIYILYETFGKDDDNNRGNDGQFA